MKWFELFRWFDWLFWSVGLVVITATVLRIMWILVKPFERVDPELKDWLEKQRKNHQ